MHSTYSVERLFDKRPVVHFREPYEVCPNCDDSSFLKVKETRSRPIATMLVGEFVAHETILHCLACKTVFPSQKFRRLAPDRSRFGYDVIEYVGRGMFLGFRRNAEIADDLKSRNIEISESEVALLGKRFIVYLALAHQEAREQLRASMKSRGGYILHLDGTCDGDSPHLVSGMDSLSQIILNSIKIPSENAEALIPFLEQIKHDYGDPLALVHDMGKGIQRAVDEVFVGIPDYICQFHFLRDVGKDLLESDYKMIRTCLKNNRIRGLLRQRAASLVNKADIDEAAIAELQASLEFGKVPGKAAGRMPAMVAFALILWILDADSESGGYGFPFDRPHLVLCQRMRITMKILREIKDRHLTKNDLTANIKANAPLARLHDLLAEMLHNRHLREAVQNLQAKADVFDRLRSAMRIALPEGKAGLNDDGEAIDIKTIETGLTEFKNWTQSDSFPYEKKKFSGLLQQLEKYWPKLLAAPIVIQTAEGPATIQPQRTNNDMERAFRDHKHGHCRKTGTATMTRALRAMLADTPLVRNLRNDEYVRLILNEHTTLAERFADIDVKQARKKLVDASKELGRLPGKLIRLLRRKKLTAEIRRIFAKAG